jgi:uncharacterized protein
MGAWLVAAAIGVAAGMQPAGLDGQGPAFDCTKAQGQVEQLVCTDAALAALDRQLDETYKAAVAKARDNVPAALRAEQRGWISGRNECWKAQGPDTPVFLTESWRATSVRECVEAQYRMRTAELQAKLRLVTPKPPVSFACQNNPANEIVATFFDTDPPTARLERGDRTVLAYLVRTASGAKYEGQNVSFWNKGSEAMVTWMNTATGATDELQCKVRH